MNKQDFFNGQEQLDANEIKRISLNILIEVDDFCKKNSIKYFLSYGTLLGAVRHKGFIPWDDDIDIVMPRDDYERFIRLFSKSGNSLYKVVNVYTDPNYHLPFLKVMDLQTMKVEEIDNYADVRGIEIDIFPLDGLSNKYKIASKQIKKVNFYLKLRNLSIYKDPGSKSIFTLIFKILFKSYCKFRGHKHWIRKAESLAKRFSYSDSKYVGNVLTLDYGNRQIFEKEFFTESVDLLFEGYYFSVPKDYKVILKQLYGDYMKLPPIEKQVSHHNFYSSRI